MRLRIIGPAGAGRRFPQAYLFQHDPFRRADGALGIDGPLGAAGVANTFQRGGSAHGKFLFFWCAGALADDDAFCSFLSRGRDGNHRQHHAGCNEQADDPFSHFFFSFQRLQGVSTLSFMISSSSMRLEKGLGFSDGGDQTKPCHSLYCVPVMVIFRVCSFITARPPFRSRCFSAVFPENGRREW